MSTVSIPTTKFKLSRPHCLDSSKYKEVSNIDKSRIIELSCYSNSVVVCEFDNKVGLASLMDSGSAISCMKTKYLKEICPNYQLHKAENMTITTAGSDKIVPEGYIYLKFKIGRYYHMIKFYIFDCLNNAVILGRDWFVRYRINLNISEQTITFPREKSTLMERVRCLNANIPLYAKETQILAQGETCLLKAEIKLQDERLVVNGLHGMIIPQKNNDYRNIINAVVTHRNGEVPIMVHNKNSQFVQVKVG